MNTLKKYTCFIIIIIALSSCNSDNITDTQATINSLKMLEKELSVSLKVDYSITSDNAIEFNNINELKAFIQNVKKQTTPVTIIKPNLLNKNFTGDCDELTGLFTGTTFNSLFTSLNYSISIINGQVESFNGFFSGITLGVSYSSGGFTDISETIIDDPSSSFININTVGTVNYTLFFNGIGTLYSQPVAYNLLIDCDQVTRNGMGIISNITPIDQQP